MPDHYIDQFDTPDVWLTPVDGMTVVDPNRHQSWIHEGGLETHQDIRSAISGTTPTRCGCGRAALETADAVESTLSTRCRMPVTRYFVAMMA